MAPVTLVMESVKYSSGSTIVSPLTATENSTKILPAGTVTEPLLDG